MEEVDTIIIQSLREVGCDIDDDAKLKNLTPEEIYKSIKILCKIIKPEFDDAPKSLPSQMAQRFSAASQLVDACKGLGYNGDLGYQTILYSNINELRRVFMWLIEHLPKSEDKTDSFQVVPISKIKNIENEIAKKIGSDFKRPWVLDFLQKPLNKSFSPITLEIPHSNSDYEKSYLPIIFHQTKNLLPSLIHTHDRESMSNNVSADSREISKKLRSSTLTSTQSLNLVPSPSRSTLSSYSNVISEKAENSIEAADVVIPKTPLEILSEKVEVLKERVDEQEDIFKQLTIDRKEQLANIESETANLEKLKKDGKLKMQISMLLDNPEESIEKLQHSLEVAEQRKQNLISKFETHKAPLEEQFESFSGKNSAKLQRIKEKEESLKSIKKTINEIHEDIKHKIQLQQYLQAELAKVKRTRERAMYTSRIADIIKSIKKQDYDIDEILKDTRSLQKSINTVEGQLQRQFTVTEELVWTKTANQDESSKKAYKLLISLHTEFSELINLIETTGSVQREIRDLEDQIDIERQQNVQQKLEQITRDLQMIENVANPQ